VTASYSAALAAFRDEAKGGWAALPFFKGQATDVLAAKLDALAASGSSILPAPSDIFAALRSSPPSAIRAVILGQDPYPTPGHAHGLSFSVRSGVAIPRSLRNIFKELEADLGHATPRSGLLTPWAEQGVLLLNACLTVEAGRAGAHRGLGWERLADEMVKLVSERSPGSVFILWGADAHRRRPLIDELRHLVIATAHPSPLSARRGFFGSRPFSRTNVWLESRGLRQIDWRPSEETSARAG
jgi:uracil-DNA glycosylase